MDIAQHLESDDRSHSSDPFVFPIIHQSLSKEPVEAIEKAESQIWSVVSIQSFQTTQKYYRRARFLRAPKYNSRLENRHRLERQEVFNDRCDGHAAG
jgi:hypothetical protein